MHTGSPYAASAHAATRHLQHVDTVTETASKTPLSREADRVCIESAENSDRWLPSQTLELYISVFASPFTRGRPVETQNTFLVNNLHVKPCREASVGRRTLYYRRHNQQTRNSDEAGFPVSPSRFFCVFFFYL